MQREGDDARDLARLHARRLYIDLRHRAISLRDGDDDYLDAVIKETLRLRPIVPDVVRRLTAKGHEVLIESQAGALAVGDVTDQLGDRPLPRRVGVKRLLRRQAAQQPACGTNRQRTHQNHPSSAKASWRSVASRSATAVRW